MHLNHPFKDIMPGPFQGIDLSFSDPGPSSCSNYMYLPSQYYQHHDINRCNPSMNNTYGGYTIPSSIGINISTTSNGKPDSASYLNTDNSVNSGINNSRLFNEDPTANFLNHSVAVAKSSTHPMGHYSSYPQSGCGCHTVQGIPITSFSSQAEFFEPSKPYNICCFGTIPTIGTSSTVSPGQIDGFLPSSQMQKASQLILDVDKSPSPQYFSIKDVHGTLSIDVKSEPLNPETVEIKSQRCSPKFTPEDKKDVTYVEKRKKNNESARKSRISRKEKEKHMAALVLRLEHENGDLRAKISASIAEIKYRKYELGVAGIL